MTPAGLILSLAGIAASLSLIMTLAFIVQQRSGNSGWIDTVWTFGLGAVGIVAALAPFAPAEWSARQIVVAAAAGLWSLRLGLHIAHRTAGIADDPRYAKLIRGWGKDARRQMFWLVQKQALVSIPLAASILIAARNPFPGLRATDFIAIAIIVVAIIGEAAADRQLRAFKSVAANKGRINDRGLWSWSRHPNYFFEWLGWVAYPLLAIDPGGAYPFGFIAFAGPVCMYWLLVHVSGVPPLEEHMLATRGDLFSAYQRRTNAFFPAPPRDETRRGVPWA